VRVSRVLVVDALGRILKMAPHGGDCDTPEVRRRENRGVLISAFASAANTYTQGSERRQRQGRQIFYDPGSGSIVEQSRSWVAGAMEAACFSRCTEEEARDDLTLAQPDSWMHSDHEKGVASKPAIRATDAITNRIRRTCKFSFVGGHRSCFFVKQRGYIRK
jgi:hypothetical protein